MKRWLSLAGIGVVGTLVALAQGKLIHGEISYFGFIAGPLAVELCTGEDSSLSERTPVELDGTFELSAKAPGIYELLVIGPQGAIIHREMVAVSGGRQVLSIRLADQRGAASLGSATISFQQLSHKVPLQAKKAFAKGEQAAAKGDYRHAADAFRQALEIDPEYVDALNGLGASESELGNLPQAAEEFQKALKLAPEHAEALPNLSIALAKMEHYREAGEVARRALKVVPGSCSIHYILAVSLMVVDGDPAEALFHLARAAAEIPHAELLSADLLLQQGRSDEAIRHLETYLRAASPHDAGRNRAEALLAQLHP
jgi:Flp pilus assembly protein TadD